MAHKGCEKANARTVYLPPIVTKTRISKYGIQLVIQTNAIILQCGICKQNKRRREKIIHMMGGCSKSSHIGVGRGRVSRGEGEVHQLLGDDDGLGPSEAGAETESQPVKSALLLYFRSQSRSQHRVQPINHNIPCQ